MPFGQSDFLSVSSALSAWISCGPLSAKISLARNNHGAEWRTTSGMLLNSSNQINLYLYSAFHTKKYLISALQRFANNNRERETANKIKRRKWKEPSPPTPTDPQTCTETCTNTFTLIHTLTLMHEDTQTPTLTPKHTLAVTKETWLGSETWGMEKATFGGPTTLRKIMVQGRRESRHRNHPNLGRQEAPHQDAEPSSYPGRNRPWDNTPRGQTRDNSQSGRPPWGNAGDWKLIAWNSKIRQ